MVPARVVKIYKGCTTPWTRGHQVKWWESDLCSCIGLLKVSWCLGQPHVYRYWLDVPIVPVGSVWFCCRSDGLDWLEFSCLLYKCFSCPLPYLSHANTSWTKNAWFVTQDDSVVDQPQKSKNASLKETEKLCLQQKTAAVNKLGQRELLTVFSGACKRKGEWNRLCLGLSTLATNLTPNYLLLVSKSAFIRITRKFYWELTSIKTSQ